MITTKNNMLIYNIIYSCSFMQFQLGIELR